MITYRTEKGAPLTIDEMDGNFRDIESRLATLETHLESGEGIGKIEARGDVLTITGTFGTNLGVFTLPKAGLRLRGPWTAQTPYQPLDVVVKDGGVYCCVTSHLSSTWDQDALQWQEILKIPHPPPLSLFEQTSLPLHEEMGKQALFIDETGLTPIFFDGKKWQRLMKGDIL